MADCAYCRVPGADLFDLQGNVVCKSCNARMQTQQYQARSDAAMAADPVGANMTFASPQKLFWTGIAMMGGAAAFGVFELFFLGRVHVILIGAIFLSGVGMLYRSWN